MNSYAQAMRLKVSTVSQEYYIYIVSRPYLIQVPFIYMLSTHLVCASSCNLQVIVIEAIYLSIFVSELILIRFPFVSL